MQRCLLLAQKGEGKVSPNPLVGAVIVRGGKIVGEGYHEKFGSPHAEANALKAAGSLARGATLYVSLEPCTSYKGKKTPPCAPRIIKAGISRVVMAAEDSNPHVRGIELLKKAGIKVETGLLAKEAKEQNAPFFHFIKTGIPYVVIKIAQSADGKMGLRCQSNVRISGAQFDAYSQELRNKYDGILVGVGTVLVDNPRLTCRVPGGRNPARIIIDNELRVLPSARILNNAGKELVIFATSKRRNRKKEQLLRKKGAKILVCGNERVEIRKLLKALPAFRVYSLIVEGGAKTAEAFLSEGFANAAVVCVSKKKLGGDVNSPFMPSMLAKMRKEKMGSDIVYFSRYSK